jgi:hypothetical protein
MLLQGCESGKLAGKKLCAKITCEKLPAKITWGRVRRSRIFIPLLCAIHMQLAGKMLLVGNGRQVFHRPLLAGREDGR